METGATSHDAERSRIDRRRRVAAMVRDLYDGKLRSSDFFREVVALDLDGDEELRELVALLRYEPANTWLFGVSGEAFRDHSGRIRELVERFSR
ncbi:MAG TPA: hypothetical protein VNK43_10400 [Gemmatimonadales bacterium]|nr:hypothetical protein [Gemmatimonadales bacterium]